MAFVSSKTLALYRVCWLWAVSYYLITSPTVIYSNSAVVVFGQAFDLPYFYREDAKLAGLLGGILMILGLEEFVVLFQDHAVDHWRGIVPLRLIAYFALTILSYFHYGPFANALTFTYVFLEVAINFLLYLIVREELNEQTRQVIRQERGQDA